MRQEYFIARTWSALCANLFENEKISESQYKKLLNPDIDMEDILSTEELKGFKEEYQKNYDKTLKSFRSI